MLATESMLIAQAVLEKAALEGMASGFSAFVNHVASVVQDRPWLWLVGAVVVLFFLLRSRR